MKSTRTTSRQPPARNQRSAGDKPRISRRTSSADTTCSLQTGHRPFEAFGANIVAQTGQVSSPRTAGAGGAGAVATGAPDPDPEPPIGVPCCGVVIVFPPPPAACHLSPLPRHHSPPRPPLPSRHLAPRTEATAAHLDSVS